MRLLVNDATRRISSRLSRDRMIISSTLNEIALENNNVSHHPFFFSIIACAYKIAGEPSESRIVLYVCLLESNSHDCLAICQKYSTISIMSSTSIIAKCIYSRGPILHVFLENPRDLICIQ